jgi:hypothetical protein
MSYRRLLLALSACCLLSTMQGACSPNSCDVVLFVEKTEHCQATGAVVVTAPPRFKITCPPTLSWNTYLGYTRLEASSGCVEDDDFDVTAKTLPFPSPGTYTTDASDLFIDAIFSASPVVSCYAGAPTTCGMSSISGTLTVESRSASGAEVSVDVQLESKIMERFSMVGHLSASNCAIKEDTSCSD